MSAETKTTSDFVAAALQKLPAAKPQQEMDDFAKRQHLMKVNELRENSQAPKRHMQSKADFSGEWGAKCNELKSRLGTGFLVALVGTRGNGKTQIGTELIRAVTYTLRKALFTTAVQFFVEIKSAYRKESAVSEQEAIRKLSKPALLVIDEFGKRGESEWENTMLFEVINNRYNAVLDTVLIDNRTKAEFIATIGPSLASRMSETGGIVECNWPSFR